VSQGKGSLTGTLTLAASLADVQGKNFAEPTLLLVESMGGNEDIPQGIEVGFLCVRVLLPLLLMESMGN
jgi:hypothetical protein